MKEDRVLIVAGHHRGQFYEGPWGGTYFCIPLPPKHRISIEAYKGIVKPVEIEKAEYRVVRVSSKKGKMWLTAIPYDAEEEIAADAVIGLAYELADTFKKEIRK